MSSFQAFGLDQAVLQAITEMGFQTPTPIQEAVIPRLLAGSEDIIGLAQTGTGKTAAFGLPIIHHLDAKSRHPQALILSPTRELALQITRDLENFSKYSTGVSVLAVYGGASMEKQARAIHSGVNVLVATPGRLVDFINRGIIKLGSLRILVLDEADEMLNMGFKEELDAILSAIPAGRQTLLFSATMPPDVARIAKNYMKEPVTVSAGKVNTGNAAIEHLSHLTHEKDRYEVLKRICDANPDIYGIVFCRTKVETQAIADKLMRDKYPAESLHGDLSQVQRDYVMGKFRDRHIRILVATDVAARGLDVHSLTHVIHYNLPDDLEVYTHRAGRTGRAGKTGISVSIVNFREKGKLKFLERSLKIQIPMKPIPTGYDICLNQLHSVIDKIHQAEIREDQISRFMPELEDKLMHLDRETLLKKVLSLEFNRFNDYYASMPDLNVHDSQDRRPAAGPGGFGKDRYRDGERSGSRDGFREGSRDRHREGSRDRVREGEHSRPREGDRERRKPAGDVEFTRFFINIGKVDGLDPRTLMGIISEATRKRNIEIGKIDLGKTHTFFEADAAFRDRILTSFQGADFQGRPVTVEEAQDKKPAPPRSGGGGDRPFKKRRFN